MSQASAKLKAKDLSKQAPRAPGVRLGGYTILARTIDKCRAHLAGTQGDYHFNCPLDNVLFKFKGIDGEAFKTIVAGGAEDEELVRWVQENGHAKSAGEIEAFAQQTVNAEWPAEKHGYRDELLKNADPSKLGKVTRIFETLELDDRTTFAQKR